MGQRSVVGDEEQSFCVFVQASYRKKPPARSIFQKGQHGSGAFVFCGGDKTGGLVEHIIEKFGVSNRNAPADHGICFRTDFCFRLQDHRAVDGDSAFLQECLDLAACSEPGIRQKFIKTDCFHGNPPCLRLISFTIATGSAAVKSAAGALTQGRVSGKMEKAGRIRLDDPGSLQERRVKYRWQKEYPDRVNFTGILKTGCIRS